MNPEKARINAPRTERAHWRKWGPYLTDRQWGTVREDYSEHGGAWEHVSHDMARSYAYRWGEDGLGGIADEQQLLCLSVALWNKKDSILKERLFGLTGNEGIHGEDVKELYYYLENVPSHSYMKMLYKYPQAEFPYAKLIAENRKLSKKDPEYELLDTGVFDKDAYWDVSIEWIKASPEDILLKVSAKNCGAEKASLEIIPLAWFRNTWAWDADEKKPTLALDNAGTVVINHHTLGHYYLYADGDATALFCDNERNGPRLYGLPHQGGFYKDGVQEFIIEGKTTSVNPEKKGTKVGIRYQAEVLPGETFSVQLRLSHAAHVHPFSDFAEIVEARKRETDIFYAEVQQNLFDEDQKRVQRQAFAGMLWTKQFYHFDVRRWLRGDEGFPAPPEARARGRNKDWKHLVNADIISMPDKWEYPWYAAWDLAFHCIPLAMIDSDFAKRQLVLMTREWYMHPNGQLPAYEWAFGDVNPPVHAWAAWRVFQIERKLKGGQGDLRFLERILHKLMLNFTWWVNRKDAGGRNIFQGGFLGLDNIGVFDRSAPLPTGGFINQADGTSWMAMYCLNLMRIALELAKHNSIYEDIASKFFEHFLFIAEAMTNMAGDSAGLWDEKDEFYYDRLELSDGEHHTMRLRSMVGLIPLFAVETLEPELLEQLPNFHRRIRWFLEHRSDLADLVSHWSVPGKGERRLLSLVRGHRMKCLLKRMLDETEFLSAYGVRALSKTYAEKPYVFSFAGQSIEVSYQPGESDSGLFGGNSNWRGPVWFPVNFLLIESLQKFHHYYGDDFKVECPTGSGQFMTIDEVQRELTRRLCSIFLRNEEGKRPVFNNTEKLQSDPNFRDHLLFYEYFHGESGRGVGASHQTGWTGLVAKLLQPRL